MARTDLTESTAEGAYGDYGANEADVTMAAGDAVNGNQFTATGNDLLIAHNTGAGAETVTITSVADEYGRSGNITTYSIGAGEYAAFGPFKRHGWMQSDGEIYVDVSSADIKLGVVRLG